MSPALRKIVFYWLPVVWWMGIISLGSSIPANGLPQLSDFWLFVAHRLAHMAEYSILAILWLRAYNFSRHSPAQDMMPVLIVSVGILGVGLLDEWHQSFVPGRTPQLLDATFDTISGTIGALLYRWWLRRRFF